MAGTRISIYLLVHLKEEYEARKNKEDSGWFLIWVCQNTADEHARILLYSDELWKISEVVGVRKRKPTRAEK